MSYIKDVFYNGLFIVFLVVYSVIYWAGVVLIVENVEWFLEKNFLVDLAFSAFTFVCYFFLIIRLWRRFILNKRG